MVVVEHTSADDQAESFQASLVAYLSEQKENRFVTICMLVYKYLQISKN